MKKICKIALNTGLIISFGLGIFHFFAPHFFQWYAYMPNAPRSLIVSIDWGNFFFSLLLSGYSLLLLIFQEEIINKVRGVFEFYVLFVMIWLTRVVITYMHPRNIDFKTVDIIQMSAFATVFLILLIPMIYSLVNNKN